MKRRILSLCLAFCMTVGQIPEMVLAESFGVPAESSENLFSDGGSPEIEENPAESSAIAGENSMEEVLETDEDSELPDTFHTDDIEELVLEDDNESIEEQLLEEAEEISEESAEMEIITAGENIFSEGKQINDEISQEKPLVVLEDVQNQISEDMVLEEDTVFTGDVLLKFGEINFNGHTMTIRGNLYQSGGTVKLNGGTLHVEGDYRIQAQETNSAGEKEWTYSNGTLIMTEETDCVDVDGDFIMDSCNSHSYKLEAGVMKLSGDFTEMMQPRGSGENNFASGGSHKVLFDGAETVQRVSFASSYSGIANLEIAQEAKVTFSGKINVGKLAGDAVFTSDDAELYGMDLAGFNLTIKAGDVWLKSGTFCLSGGNWTVCDNLYQEAGVLEVSGGTLHVKGDYRLQSQETNSAGEKEWTYSNGFLKMTEETDCVDVDGNFIMDSCNVHGELLTAGVMKLSGDFAELNTGSGTGSNFASGGSHKVLFDGAGAVQRVSFASSYSGIANLEIAREAKVTFSGKINVGKLAGDAAFASDNAELYGMDLAGYNLTIKAGDVWLKSGTFRLSGGNWTVCDNLYQEAGVLEVSGGTLHVKGDYRLQSQETNSAGEKEWTYSNGFLKMTEETDCVDVDGDFIMDSCNVHGELLTAGVMKLSGDFAELNTGSGTGSNFASGGSHKVLFDGAGAVQRVSFASSYSGIANLEIAREAKVTFSGKINVGKLAGDAAFTSDNAELYGMDLAGYNLTIKAGDVWLKSGTFKLSGGSCTIPGNLYQSGGEINLSGGSCTITHSLYQSGGSVVLDGGALYIGENYRIQSRTINEDGKEEWTTSSGSLIMQKEEDYLYVAGAFVMDSENSHRGCLTNGMMVVSGSFTQKNGAEENFYASNNHTVFLNSIYQEVKFESESSGFQFLQLAMEQEDYEFSRIPCWNELVEMCGIESGGRLEVAFAPETDIQPYQNMFLNVQCGESRTTRRTKANGIYVFTSLPVGEKCKVTLVNQAGDVLAEADAITIKRGDNRIVLDNLLPVANTGARVYDENGNDVTEQTTVEWLNADGGYYVSGTELTAVPVGTSLICRVRLNNELGKLYEEPERREWTVSDKNARCIIYLKKYTKVSLAGTVTDGEEPIAGASVTLEQQLNGRLVSETVIASRQGVFEMEAYALPGSLKIAASGYQTETISFEEAVSEQNIGEIVLKDLSGIRVQLDIVYTNAAKEGTAPSRETERTADTLDFEVYNETSGQNIGEVIAQYSTLTLPEGAKAGDRLRLTVSDRNNEFTPVTEIVEIDGNGRASVRLELLQYGFAEISGGESGNSAIRILMYRPDGKLAWSEACEQKETLQSIPLPDGEYKIAAMGGGLFTYPQTWESLQAMGLEEGQDYAVKNIAIEAGKITEAVFETVPKLDESRFYFTDVEKTQFSLNKTQTSVGKYVTLRAAAPFKEEYKERISDLRWILEFSEGLSYVDGTLTIAGEFSKDVLLENDRMIVYTEDSASLMRLCLIPLAMGSSVISGSLEFKLDGRQIRQPVGSVKLSTDEMTFELCGKTASTNVNASGKALANAMVYLYDNEVMVGQKKAGPTGNWSLNFELYKPYTYSVHQIYAEIVTEAGQRMRTQTRQLVYQYFEDSAELSKVWMIYQEDKILFDFKNPEQSGNTSYSYNPSYPTFSFLIEFEGAKEKIDTVQLEVFCSNGSSRMLYAEYNEEKGYWTTSDSFDTGSLPTTLRVYCDRTDGMIFSREQQTERRGELEKLSALIDDEEDDSASFDDLDMSEISDNLQNMLRSYEEALGNLEKSSETFDSIMETYTGEIKETEEGIVFRNNYGCSILEQLTCDGITPEELLEEGYEKCQTTAGSPIYVKRNETTGVCSYADFDSNIFMKFTEQDSMARGSGGESLESMRATLETIINKMEAGYSGYLKWIKTSMDIIGDLEDAAAEEMVLLQDKAYGHMDIKAGLELKASEINKKILQYPIGSEEGRELLKQLDSINLEINRLDRKVDKISKNYEVLEKASKSLEIKVKALKALGTALSAMDIGASIYTLRNHLSKFSELIEIYNRVSPPGCEVCRSVRTRCLTLGGMLLVYDVGQVGGLLSGWQAFSKKTVAKITKNIIKKQLAADLSAVLLEFSDKFNFDKNLEENLSSLWETAKIGIQICTSNEKEENFREPVPDFFFAYYFNGIEKTGIIDPSGYIYEAVPSNRLEGVTATCYQKVTKYDMYEEPYEEIEFWDAQPYEQSNPLVTNAQGEYAWDVPEGKWQIKYEKEGYETAYSDWLDVPPPHFDVNIGLISYEAPEVTRVMAYQDSVDIAFSKYMKARNLQTASIRVLANGKRIKGSIILRNGEENPRQEGELLASRVQFIPDTPIAIGEKITVEINRASYSYAGVPLDESYHGEFTVAERTESFTASAEILVYTGQDAVVSLEAAPASAAAGKKVQIRNRAEMLFTVQESQVIFDENGKALVHVSGEIPGEGALEFVMEEADLTAQTRVRVENYTVPVHTHELIHTAFKAATCIASGNQEYWMCSSCGKYFCDAGGTAEISPESVVLPFTAHTPAAVKGKAAGCTSAGLTDGSKCSVCGKVLKAQENIKASGHKWDSGKVTKAATTSEAGIKTYTCTVCRETKIETIPKLQKENNTITAANITKTYSAKKRTFSIGAKAKGNAKLTYKSNHKSVTVNASGKVTIAKKFIGKATITITAAETEAYHKAVQKITVKVNPTKTSLSKVTNPKSKKITVKWKKNTSGSGYQIQYSTDKKFKKGVKTVKIKKKGTTSTTISKLKKGKTYYVRIRTVKGSYYSGWSGVKQVKIRK